MMGRAEAAVAEARRWLGTPYVHQAAMCGAGTDCLGLIRGVWRTLYGAEPETVPPYTQDWAEPGNREELWQAARRWLKEVPRREVAVADVLLFRMRTGSIAKHLGLVTAEGPEACFIHAYSGHGVIESSLSSPWLRRVVAKFEFPTGV
jgi:NlpC/P60 family putative phage cell wall peptidase